MAGTRRFVSLDVVFGELFQKVAPLLEKHFAFRPEMRLEKLPADLERWSYTKVWKISPLNVAYEGHESLVHITFRSNEEGMCDSGLSGNSTLFDY